MTEHLLVNKYCITFLESKLDAGNFSIHWANSWLWLLERCKFHLIAYQENSVETWTQTKGNCNYIPYVFTVYMFLIVNCRHVGLTLS